MGLGDRQDPLELLHPGADRQHRPDAGGVGARRRHAQPFLPQIDADHAPRAVLRHLHGFIPRTAAEIQNDLSGDVVPDARPHQHFHLRSAGVNSRLSIGEFGDFQARDRVEHRCADRGHAQFHAAVALQAPRRLV